MTSGNQADDPQDLPPEIPFGVPTAARMYDAALGGKDNFEVDRIANEKLYAAIGEKVVRGTAQENRLFLARAVKYLANECGVQQFLDLGSGLPTAHNTHEIAQQADPRSKVVYVDIDPIVAVHGRALLAADNTRIVTADMRKPETVLDNPATRELIDFSRPVALLFVAVFHFTPPSDDPAGIIAAFRERQVPGSYVTIAHLTTDGMSPDERRGWLAGFDGAANQLALRSEKEIRGLFDGYELVKPGLVRPHLWRPEDDGSPETTSLFAGVGRL
ncbi:MAG: SAM-dependent methyltransferase [Actinoallomurus sp.]